MMVETVWLIMVVLMLCLTWHKSYMNKGYKIFLFQLIGTLAVFYVLKAVTCMGVYRRTLMSTMKMRATQVTLEPICHLANLLLLVFVYNTDYFEDFRMDGRLFVTLMTFMLVIYLLIMSLLGAILLLVILVQALTCQLPCCSLLGRKPARRSRNGS